MLKAYFARKSGEATGIAVIAETAKEARKLAYYSCRFDCEYIDIRATLKGYVCVDGLQKGILNDNKEALRRGIFDYIERGICDLCGEVKPLERYKDKIICKDCADKVVV